MGLFDALTTAVSGLQAQAFAMQNISGNIANSQTIAYKGINTSFEDLIPGANTPSQQIAGGVIASSAATNSVQGAIQAATSGTDMAINGDGYFLVQPASSFNGSAPVFTGVDSYTRRGDFQLDANGYLVNGAGYYLEGIPIDPTTGAPAGNVASPLQFQNNFLPANATTQVDYGINLADNATDRCLQCDCAKFRVAQSRGFHPKSHTHGNAQHECGRDRHLGPRLDRRERWRHNV